MKMNENVCTVSEKRIGLPRKFWKFYDEEYSKLQWRLIEFPDAGDIIKGSGGIRKIRLSAKGKGTRGGARVIYYFAAENQEIYMLDIYVKNEQTDLIAKTRIS